MAKKVRSFSFSPKIRRSYKKEGIGIEETASLRKSCLVTLFLAEQVKKVKNITQMG